MPVKGLYAAVMPHHRPFVTPQKVDQSGAGMRSAVLSSPLTCMRRGGTRYEGCSGAALRGALAGCCCLLRGAPPPPPRRRAVPPLPLPRLLVPLLLLPLLPLLPLLSAFAEQRKAAPLGCRGASGGAAGRGGRETAAAVGRRRQVAGGAGGSRCEPSDARDYLWACVCCRQSPSGHTCNAPRHGAQLQVRRPVAPITVLMLLACCSRAAPRS